MSLKYRINRSGRYKYTVNNKIYKVGLTSKHYCPNCGNDRIDDLIRLRIGFFACRKCGYEFDVDE